jgi:hypothetical protein
MRGLQNQPEACGERKILSLPGLELRPLGLPARSQSLYRLPRFLIHLKMFSPLLIQMLNACCFGAEERLTLNANVPDCIKRKLSLHPSVEVHILARRRGFQVFQTIGSQMAVRLSTLRANRPLSPKKISGTHFCYRLSRPQGHNVAGRIRSV